MNKKDLRKLLDSLQEETESLELNSKILLIDGLNTFMRSFCMINHLNTSGDHIGGMVGFLKSVGYAIKIIQPTRVIIVFDGPGNSDSKKNLYSDYKSNRHVNRVTNYDIFSSKEEEDEAIIQQMNRLIQYLQCLPLDLVCIDGLEADDIIGLLVTKFEQNESTKEITIMSADRDFLQEVSEKTQVYSPTKKKFYKIPDIIEEYKIHPNNFIIYKSLLGDKSDNLPGISGLGEKKLLKFFPELVKEEILSLNDILSQSQERLSEHKIFTQIVERKHQLEINFKLMNLKESVISPDNVNIIESILLNTSKVWDKHKFLIMYHSDMLGESIGNVSAWVETSFRSLQSFR